MEPKPADDLEAVIETLRRHNYDFRGKIGEGGHATVFSVWSQNMVNCLSQRRFLSNLAKKLLQRSNYS